MGNIDFTTFQTKDREVEFVLKNGQKTGLFLNLVYESKGQVQDVDSAYRRKMIQAARKGRGGGTENLTDQYTEEKLLAHVTGWRWAENSALTHNNERPAFSHQKLKEMINSGELGVMLKEFINQEVSDAADFLDKSGNA
jgi:hypothetical protein